MSYADVMRKERNDRREKICQEMVGLIKQGVENVTWDKACEWAGMPKTAFKESVQMGVIAVGGYSIGKKGDKGATMVSIYKMFDWLDQYYRDDGERIKA